MIRGAGTKAALGRVVAANATLDVSALSGILSYEPEELVITIRAGTTVREINEVLAEREQKLGFEPADWGPLLNKPAAAATIGGVISADASGSASVLYGRARDHLLGYRAVNGEGEVYKAGGRVVKNVTGFDLSKLMCGAFGTLGVITELTLRVYPRAPEERILIVDDVGAEEGLALLRALWSMPLAATGLAYLPDAAAALIPGLGPVGRGAALVRLEGSTVSLSEIESAATCVLAGHAVRHHSDDNVFAILAGGALFDEVLPAVWRLSLPPANADSIVSALKPRFWCADCAGGQVWMSKPEGAEASAIHKHAREHGGHAMLMRADDTLRKTVDVFPPLEATERLLAARVKARFDPFGVLNSGRMYKGV